MSYTQQARTLVISRTVTATVVTCGSESEVPMNSSTASRRDSMLPTMIKTLRLKSTN